MKKALLIAEKPSLKRTIEDVYNKHKSEIPLDIVFFEQRGHLITLKSPDELDDELKTWSWDTLPIIPENYGGFKYKIIEEKKTGKFLTASERYSHIKKELSSGKYDLVINAGDPDQEGELLIRIVLASMHNKLPIKRYWSNATNEENVLDALKTLRDDDNDDMLKNLLAAAYGRQHSDYRFGMNLSRAASLKMNTRVACGRVKTPILAIVCRREQEIKDFKPSTCYGIRVNYTEGFSGQMVDVSAIVDDTEKRGDESGNGLMWFNTQNEADDYIRKLSSPLEVVDYKSEKVATYAPKLFKLATAQIAAGKMGYGSSQTLEIIQSLYEKGYMSYPRTDCEYLASTDNLGAMLKSAASVSGLLPFIKSINIDSINKVRATKKWVDDKKLADSGHSALAPTSKKPNLAELTEDEQKIYTLICRQFVAIFLPPLIQNKTQLLVKSGADTFKSTGKTLVDAGFSAIFGTKFTDMVIPVHNKGDMITATGFDTVSKTTVCPKHLTDADLIAICEAPHKFLTDKSYKSLGENLKIGTPATRASIIKELITKDKYLQICTEKKAKYLTPTPTGSAIYENLKDCDICRVDLTAQWEEQLESVRRGELSLSELETGMKNHVARLVEDIKNADITPFQRKEYATVCKCPKCGGDIKSGPKGFYCSNYKEGCKVGAYKKVWDSIVTDEEFASLLSGNEISKMVSYNKSKWEARLIYDFDTGRINNVKHEESTSYKCPKCGKPLTDDGRVLSCKDGCFKFWKTAPGGKAITAMQIENFFANGTTGIIKGMKGKSGKGFNAEIVLKEDRTGTEFKYCN